MKRASILIIITAAVLIISAAALLPAGEELSEPPAELLPSEAPEKVPEVRPAIESAEIEKLYHPDPLGIRELKISEKPCFYDEKGLSAYVLRELLSEKSCFEFNIGGEALPEGTDIGELLGPAFDNAMSYYLFGTIGAEAEFEPQGTYISARVTVSRGDEINSELALAAARDFTAENPLPPGGFENYGQEREYALLIHDYLARSNVFSPIGYTIGSKEGIERGNAGQEACNALSDECRGAVCAGYARAFALLAQWAGIDCAWVWGNLEGEQSHAWNVIYPLDGSEAVIVDVTWDDVLSEDVPGQEYVSRQYFYVPLSQDDEHIPEAGMGEFLPYIHSLSGGLKGKNQD